MTALIRTDEPQALLGTEGLVILNGSWHMPAEKRQPQQEHVQQHIPGAVFFDIDAISDASSPYPHMLPDAERFAAAVSALGISNSSQIVVYDSTGLFSAARVWWMFRAFGHETVRVLDGGLPKWLAEGKPVEHGEQQPAYGQFRAVFRPERVRTIEQMQRNLDTHAEQVVDARAAGRFNGSEPEPRPGLRSGHIPGSFNVPFRECTLPPYHTLKSPRELRAVFEAHGLDLSRPLTASCGSGVTACVLALALFELGVTEVPVYDGAWAEWGTYGIVAITQESA